MNELTTKPSLPTTQNCVEPCSSKVDPNDVITVLLGLLDGLSNLMMSGDMWYLAMRRAEDIAVTNGVSLEDAQQITERINVIRLAAKRRSPFRHFYDKE